MDYIGKFQSDITHYNYIGAASIYISQGYRYQKQFNEILEIAGCKTLVFELINSIQFDGLYYTDPAGGEHRTDENNPAVMYK